MRIKLPGNKTFEIVAPGNTRATKYVKSMKLNGKTLKTPFFTNEEMMKGGKLELVVSD